MFVYFGCASVPSSLFRHAVLYLFVCLSVFFSSFRVCDKDITCAGSRSLSYMQLCYRCLSCYFIDTSCFRHQFCFSFSLKLLSFPVWLALWKVHSHSATFIIIATWNNIINGHLSSFFHTSKIFSVSSVAGNLLVSHTKRLNRLYLKCPTFTFYVLLRFSAIVPFSQQQ